MGRITKADKIVRFISFFSLILFLIMTLTLLENGKKNFVHALLPIILVFFLFIAFLIKTISLPPGSKRIFSKIMLCASFFLFIGEIINTSISISKDYSFVFNTPADFFYFFAYAFFFVSINMLLKNYFKHNLPIFFACVIVLTIFGYYLLFPILTSPLFGIKEKIFNLFYLVSSLIVMLLSSLILINKKTFLSFSEKIFFFLALINNSLYNFYSLVINYKGFYKTPPTITSFFALTYLFLIFGASFLKTENNT